MRSVNIMAIRAAAVALAVILLVSSIPCPAGAELPLSEFKHVKLAAVYTTSTGEERGVLTDLYVYATPGSGHVFVDTHPFTQIDMQGSARLAAMVACDVLGLNYRDYDFYYLVKVDSPVAGGPSGGASMTVATIASLLNLSMRNDVVMTGMINPDGSVGPVGGIPSKLRAAASEGATMFLIPKGQGTVYVKRLHQEQRGPFVLITEKVEKVDVIELGRSLGVQVVEIEDIRDALRIFTGYAIEEKKYAGGALTEQFKQTMRPLAERLLNEVETTYARLSQTSAPSLSSELGSASSMMEHAKSLYAKGAYYASTSQSFGALIKLRYVDYASGYLKAQNGTEYLAMVQDEVREEIDRSNKSVRDAANTADVINLEGLGAAESRVQKAQELLAQAMESQSVAEQLSLLAFAYERARSAQWWIAIAQQEGVKGLDEDELRELAAGYISQAQSIAAYSSTLLQESGATGLMPLLDGASSDIESAKTQFQEGFYAGAIYDALRSMVGSSVAIELIGQRELSENLKRAEESARNAIIEERRYGIEPILAASAYENAMEGQLGEVDRLVELEYARLTARTTVRVLSDLGYAEVGTSVKSVEDLLGKASSHPSSSSTSTSTPSSEHSPPAMGDAGWMLMVALLVAGWLRATQRK
ncbi:MAG: uncharacterized protein PWP01_718 [Methanosarcinales archaeon]|nr:uncharacterized protein [Methanosarcinales archaeon]